MIEKKSNLNVDDKCKNLIIEKYEEIVKTKMMEKDMVENVQSE